MNQKKLMKRKQSRVACCWLDANTIVNPEISKQKGGVKKMFKDP
jgi:hypothetical protein